VLYEAPHRLLDTLRHLLAALGDRPAVAARELTKKFEQVVRGSLSELVAQFERTAPRGEFTIVVAGAPATVDHPSADLASPVEEVRDLVAAGLSRSRAIAHVAKHRGIARNTLYRGVVGQERARVGQELGSCPEEAGR
jgi:16S rRNA (cytidine1402-2'-O)-methyltransferase